MNSNYMPSPEDFEDRHFAENNKQLFDEYIDLIILGVDKREAFSMAFGYEFLTDNFGLQRCMAIQRNPYVKEWYKKRMAAMDQKEMWSVKQAIHNLLKIIRDPGSSYSARLNSIRELNIIYGITVIDELGNTKLGRSMEDFYRGMGSDPQDGLPYPSNPQKH